jgi:pyridoxal phosphate enzyme (YggS family)
MIAENLKKIRQQIRSTALRCNRDPESVRLVAVSKTFPVADMKEAIAAGQILFGENYIQEVEQKFSELGNQIQLHFIGHLQSNKAKIAAGIFQMIETVDSLKLAAALDRNLLQYGRMMDILVQVNIGRDENKSGIEPDNSENFLKEIKLLKNLRVRGLMTMPPFSEDPEKSRIHFRALRNLAENLRNKNLFFDNATVELSMGMSHDYTIAIEEGATLVRVGSAIFGQRE